jgi:hypothetical protein
MGRRSESQKALTARSALFVYSGGNTARSLWDGLSCEGKIERKENGNNWV